MPSENSMILAIKRKINALPKTRIKKLWSSAANRDIDLLIVTHGIACFYEIKVRHQLPTDWQMNKLAWWAESCADTGWFDDVDDCVARVKKIAERAATLECHLEWIIEK